MRAAFLLVLAIVALAPSARAQYFSFGKNRVQYEGLDWRYVQTAHFDVHFYERAATSPGGRVLAEAAAAVAEEAYAELADLFAYELAHRIPILVYQGHNEFAVTNAVELPVYAEGIGGATELYKNRIAVPFTGDWRAFRRVVRHELVHAVLNDLFYGGSLQAAIRTRLQLRLPDWFDEGLAEYAAFGWDSSSDLFLRDAVLEGYLPPIYDLDGYFAYRGGQGVWDFVAEEYGREKVGEILQRVHATRSVEAGFLDATGLSLGELSERWHDALREAHYPEVAAREALADRARPLADGPTGGRYHASPALSPQGDRVAYVAATDALFDVYVAPTAGGGRPEKVVDGQDNTAFESLRILSPGLAWDPSGTRLAVAVKSGPADAIAVLDVDRRREVARFRVPGVDAVLSVAWSPDSSRIAFEGTAGAHSDLFLLDLDSGSTTNLTNDLFSDHEPAWSPDGRALAFHSDRGDVTGPGRPTAADASAGRLDPVALASGDYDLFLLHLDERRIERLTTSDADETAAQFGGPDSLLFVSDRNGTPNLYALGLTTGAERPLSDLSGGILGVSLAADGGRAVVLALNEGTPALHLLRDPFASESLPGALAPTVWAQRRTGGATPAPAVALASPANLQGNPFLRDATDGAAYAHLDPPPLDSLDGLDPLLDSLLNALGGAYGGGPEPDSAGGAHVFSDSVEAARLAAPENPFLLTNNRDASGALRVRRYRLAFSPDLVYAAGGYDTVFGVQSVTQMLFSDLLGNHRLTFATNLVLDLRNADYFLAYEAVGGRMDYNARGFHLARELASPDSTTIYRYRNYGVSTGLSYPLDKFRRLDADLALVGVGLTDLSDLGARPRTRWFTLPRLTFTSDRTTPGWTAPGGGRRWAVSLSGSPGPSVNFATVLADIRQYAALAPSMLGPGYGVALRLSAGASVGPDPQRFYAAGVPAWLNPSYESLPIEDPDDFAFATPVLPLRGFGFNEAVGDRFALANAEVRVPLVAALLPGPLPILPLYNLQAVAFADAGIIAERGFQAWREVDDGAGGTRRVFDDVLVGAGVGLRTVVLGYPLRVDWAWPFDGERFGEARAYFSVGLDF